MTRRSRLMWLGAMFVAQWISMSPAAAQLGLGYGLGGEEEGFFLFVEAVLATPRGADQVVGTTEADVNGTRTLQAVAVDWGTEPAGRLTAGYTWASGMRVAVRYWRFDNDARVRGDGPAGGLTHFQVGTPIYAYGNYYGTLGSPGHFDFVGRIEAESLDLDWGRSEEFSERLHLDWSLGLRFARFDETLEGFYDFDASTSAYFGEFAYFASRTTETRMTGVGAALEGDYRFTDRLHLRGRAALSALDGTVEGRNNLVPVGAFNTDLPAAVFAREDDDASGTITALELRAVWDFAGGAYRAWVGYERREWDGLPADLTRNPPGASILVRPRDRIVFSGFNIGVGFRF